jgi:formylglycine-generating enzyme required for sulfatase activity
MKRTMKTKSRFLVLALSASWPLTVPAAHADTFGSGGNTFTIGFVPIGNAGNANDTRNGAEMYYGAVPYNFNMSTYAISQDQLAKASNSLGISLGGGRWVGSQPAAGVTWYQAAAFVNYLNTSAGHAAAYNLNAGATALTLWSSAQAWQAGGENLYRNKDAYYFLPSENEYYKAAYYDPNKAGGAGYWLYATGSDAIPTAVASGTAAGTAVYDGVTLRLAGPAPVDQSGGLSPYGTMGQSGNINEWLETESDGVNDFPGVGVTLRGGEWNGSGFPLRSSSRSPYVGKSNPVGGFRVASVPEPSCMILMLGSGMILLARRRRGPSL